MSFAADLLLATGAFAAALYCYVLSTRLSRFAALEGGIGSAVAVLSAQVDDMTVAIRNAQAAAIGSTASLEDKIKRAEAAATRIELLLASLHDLPDADIGESPGRGRRVLRRRAPREVEAVE